MHRTSILAVIALAALLSPACGSSALDTSGHAGTTGHAGSNGQAAGSTGEGGTTGQAGTTGAGGQAAGCGAASQVDASSSADKTVVASIRVSASTNTPQIDVVVYSDGSAERTVGAPRIDGGFTVDAKSFAAGSPEVLTFLCDLAAAGPVSQIQTTTGTGACGKSVSFGTTTMVSVGSEPSGDLECIDPSASAAARALAHDCDVLTARLS